MVNLSMPKFLSDLTPQDWFKLAGLAVMGALLYADVHSSIDQQVEHNKRQDAKISKVEKTIAEALTKQANTNEKIADTLSEMNGSLKAIEANSGQMDKRIERIERKL